LLVRVLVCLTKPNKGIVRSRRRDIGLEKALGYKKVERWKKTRQMDGTRSKERKIGRKE
jgi:hypothetical protein